MQVIPHRIVVSKRSFNALKKAVENLRNQGVSKNKKPRKGGGNRELIPNPPPELKDETKNY
ncbi:MAG TPA: hypothetical protein HPP51_03105 [Planctomycetes bacterium]|nr:hypothetical protein [Planctomycetota bacterium]